MTIKEVLAKIDDNINRRRIIYFAICCCALLSFYIIRRFGFVGGFAFAIAPIAIAAAIFSISSLYYSYIAIFIINYFLGGLSRYFPFIPSGIFLDAMLAYTLFLLLINIIFFKTVRLRSAFNLATIVSFIWMIFCLFQLLNIHGQDIAWLTSVRGIGFYFFIITFFCSLVYNKFTDFKRIMFILSILSLLAVVKALIQKFIGFDSAESRWLFVEGGRITHIIYTGTRYFSFYTDASTFGASMGMSSIMFAIIGLSSKAKERLYYFAVSLLSCYAMFISGTRSALAVPLAGAALYIILSKKPQLIFLSLITFCAILYFFKFTMIGESNADIRRMRSAFNIEDASLNVRLENQKKMKEIMKDYPFGTGIGMGGFKAQKFAPNSQLANIPTDSWFVMIWVETGFYGLILHIFLLSIIILYGIYLVLFVLRNEQLITYTSAAICGVFGITVASYGNEIMGQIPVAMITYTLQAFIVMSAKFDKELMGPSEKIKLKQLIWNY